MIGFEINSMGGLYLLKGTQEFFNLQLFKKLLTFKNSVSNVASRSFGADV